MASIGKKEFFKGIEEIKYEGEDSKNPLAFKYYNPDKKIAGKTMRDHFKKLRGYLKVEYPESKVLEIGSNDGVFLKPVQKDNLNQNLKHTTSQIINLDSQYRETILFSILI